MKIKLDGKEVELTADEIEKGKQAHKQAVGGENPASWVEDEDTWEKAKEAANKGDYDEDSYWAVVTHIYKNMGGTIKSRDAIVSTQPELTARTFAYIALGRMSQSEGLQAGIASGGFTFSDFQTQLGEAVRANPKLNTPAGEGMTPAPALAWVADIIVPGHETGEQWEAVVCGADGKLYVVQFKINADKTESVEIVGDPKEVERVTDYEYVYQPAQAATQGKGKGEEGLQAAEDDGEDKEEEEKEKCPHCGEEVEMQKCPECGDEEMCPECGYCGECEEVTEDEEGEEDEDEDETEAKNKNGDDALKAGDTPGHPFRGNQYSGAGEGAAYEQGEKAYAASRLAKKEGTAEAHQHAAELHRKAAEAHLAGHKAETEKGIKSFGKTEAKGHEQFAKQHERLASRLRDSSGERGGRSFPEHRLSKMANTTSKRAEQASRESNRGSMSVRQEERAHTKAERLHYLASQQHGDASNEFYDKADKARDRGDEKQARAFEKLGKQHDLRSMKHEDKQGFHQSQLNFIHREKQMKGRSAVVQRTEAWEAKEEADKTNSLEAHAKAAQLFHQVGMGLEASGDTREANAFKAIALEHREKSNPSAIDCASKESNSLRTHLQSDEPGVIMYMPGGLHTITPSHKGRPVTVTVMVDAGAAETLEKQRQKLEAKGKKPFFSVQHETEIAAFWPTKFFWDKRIDATGSLVEGVWAEGEWTKSGKEAVEGKDFRTFSPTFFVDGIRNDKDKPCKIVCNDEARANMGALENDPAFQEISPLWARNAGAPGGSETNNNGDDSMFTKEQVAELQARKTQLERKLTELEAKSDAVSKAELKAAQAEKAEIEANLRLAAVEEKAAALEAQETKRRESDAERAVQEMVASGKIPVRDKELQAEYKDKFTKDPSLIKLLGGVMGTGSAVTGRVTPSAGSIEAGARGRVEGGWSMEALKKYAEIVSANANIDIGDPFTRFDAYRQKGRLATEAAVYFKTELMPHVAKWEHAPLIELGKAVGLKASGRGVGTRIEVGAEVKAADYSADNAPSNVLGVLTGTLVLQRTLPFFAYKYPELLMLYTDFSDTPGLLGQTENTRIVTQQAVQTYDTTTDGTGRPKGWSTISPASVTDVPLTLTDYVAVPINFGQNQLGATARRLFDEQSVLAIKALAGYFVGKLCDLFTKANYNSYAVANGTTVPTAYASYVKGLVDFAMSDLDNLDAAFTSNKVPEEDRGLMLSPSYYAKLRGDPRLSFMYAASAKDVSGGAGEFLTEAKLPKLSGFAPYKAPYLPGGTPVAAPTTNNLVGFAFQKAGAVLKSRLPQDFTQALGVMIPGSVTTITDPDTKISIMLVQYVSLQGGWAEWRPEVILGVAKGDPRAGLCLTSA